MLTRRPGAQHNPLSCVHKALEDRVLDTLSVVFAEACNSAQAAASCIVACADIVGDQDHHRRLSPEESGLGVEAAANVACQ
jgi:hypothetical protein